MKKTMKKLSIVAALFAASNAFAQDIQPRGADDILTGDTRLACELYCVYLAALARVNAPRRLKSITVYAPKNGTRLLPKEKTF